MFYSREEIDATLDFLSLYLGCMSGIAYMEFGVDTMLGSKAAMVEFIIYNHLRSNITTRLVLLKHSFNHIDILHVSYWFN